MEFQQQPETQPVGQHVHHLQRHKLGTDLDSDAVAGIDCNEVVHHHHHHYHYHYDHCTFNDLRGTVRDPQPQPQHFQLPHPYPVVTPPSTAGTDFSIDPARLLDFPADSINESLAEPSGEDWVKSFINLDPTPVPTPPPDPGQAQEPRVPIQESTSQAKEELTLLTEDAIAVLSSASSNPTDIMDNHHDSEAQRMQLPDAQQAEANAAESDSTTRPTQKKPKASKSACLSCRSRHLKCNGENPCDRCEADGRGEQCTFIKSRRGYRGPGPGPSAALAQNPNKRRAVSPPEPDADRHDVGASGGASSGSIGMCAPQGTQTSSPGSSTAQTPNSSSTQSQRRYREASGTDLSTYELSPPARNGSGPVSSQPLLERCLDAFYSFFHGAHPFVLPKEFLLQISYEPAVEPLLAAMRWVGSMYIDVANARESLLQEARHRLRSIPLDQRDGFTLQTMMVMIVGLDGATLNEEAREMLLQAEKLARDIFINTKPFAGLTGRGSPVLEESWRRTWWDLFVIDAMIAGVHRQTNFALFDEPADVDLPCEEAEFLSGNIPPPRSLEELEDQDFTAGPETRPFSSFAYRILCARNLGKIFRAGTITSPTDPNLPRLQALLTNWALHLPPSKRDPLDSSGRVDEMLFQAHMMINATSILLNQPHSQLDSSPAETITSCAPHQAVLVSEKPFNAHTRHTLTAAASISHLVSLPVSSLTTHTHFFTCVLTLSSIVHLCKWALKFVQYDDDDLRQLLRLNIGALNELSKVWPAAERAKGQVRGVAGEIFAAKKAVQQMPRFWMGVEQGVVDGTLEVDRGIIEEIEAEQQQ